MLSLAEFRLKAKGLPDYLPWAALIDNGIVLTKAGGLMAAWEYAGPDLDSATQDELVSMASRVNGALALGEGWVLHADAVRAMAPGYAPEGAFPDRTTRMIDDIRRQHFESEGYGFKSRYVLTVTWFPPVDRQDKTARFFTEGGAESTCSAQLERFHRGLREIEDRLSGVARIRRLADSVDERTGVMRSELLAHLESCVTMRNATAPFAMSSVPMYLDAVLGQHDLVSGFQPRIDDQYITAICITGFPPYSVPGMFDRLARLPVEYRWSTRFIELDPQEAEQLANSYRSKWAQKRKSMMNFLREAGGGQATHINLDADRAMNDAIVAVAEASQGKVIFGYYTSVLLLADRNLPALEDAAQDIRKVILNLGFQARIETVNAVDAYLGTMPGNTVANVRRPVLHTLNLAHLMPFTSVWAGPDENPCPFYRPRGVAGEEGAKVPPLLWTRTAGATPFRLCLHAGDLGHAAVLGPTGSGKSTLLAMTVAQHFRYARAQVFVFDKGYSMLPLVWAAGGEHYDIASGADGVGGPTVAFAPLGRCDEESEQRWAAEWLESCIELQGVRVTPEQRQEIYHAVKQLGDFEDPTLRTLGQLRATIQDADLRTAIEPYTVRGGAGDLLDAKEDGLGQDRFQMFEMEHLLERGDRVVLPVLTYLFHRLEQRFDGRPTLLVLDEAWVMLGHPVFKAKIREWLKVLRRANVAVVFATQSLSDLAKSGIADVIVESCPTKILLPNAAAREDVARGIYRELLGLNDRQIEMLAAATPKRQYYMLHPDGRRLFELGLSGPELAFVGSSSREVITRIRDLRAASPDGWPAQWLRERGEWAWAQAWENYQ